MYDDLPEDELRAYKSSQTCPDDFDSFWEETLEESRRASGDAVVERVSVGLETVNVYDVTSPGFGGNPTNAITAADAVGHGRTYSGLPRASPTSTWIPAARAPVGPWATPRTPPGRRGRRSRA
ncbi:acetylxylan esterase [Sinomonas humi]|uniref:acetylxylan esterase n=1 Tax=Sinomonas humi TaxID=1338436 RepID=UPI0038B4ED3B